MRNIPVTLDEHVDCLRSQARSTQRALRVEMDLLERFLAGGQFDPREIDQLRSQGRAALSSLRSTNQLLARAAQMQEHQPQPQEAQTNEHRSDTARVG